MTEKTELVITALQQRIGEIVSSYETQIAILRAEITKLFEEKQSLAQQLEEKHVATETYSEHLDNLTTN